MLNIKLPSTLDQEILDLAEHIRHYQAGEIPAAELKARRVPFGVYEQRKADTYMVRVRCPGGVITPAQLEKVAAISVQFGNLPLHITTRQEIQLHDAKLSDLVPIMKELVKWGLSTRGGGGNTVRNVIIQEDAGIDPNEVFDVTPYALALTERLIDEPDSWTLPRKFKVAFSGTTEDKGLATFADVGFIAAKKNNERGFIVYIAGGLGAKSDVSIKLFDFVPDTQVYAIVRAAKMLFWKQGNRKNKHAARLRFLRKKLGETDFLKAFHEEYIEAQTFAPLTLKPVENVAIELSLPAVAPEDKNDFALWSSRFVTPQKQADSVSIIVPIEFGFLGHDFSAKLAAFLKPFGENTLRFTKNQNMIIRNIKSKYLPNVYQFLKQEQLHFNRPLVLDTMISCAGASTCQLGLCLSRGAATAVIETLSKSDLPLDKFSDLHIHFSGCPNSCGQHPLADIGFFGKANRHSGVVYPAYNVVAGAVIREGASQLASVVGEISAKDLPQLMLDVLTEYSKSAPKGTLGSDEKYWQIVGKESILKSVEKHKDIPTFEKDSSYYIDWSATDAFSLAGRGTGECSAGFFDLIDVDNSRLDEALKNADAYKSALYACRMLLITRAEEPKTDVEVFNQFKKHFMDTGLVDEKFGPLISLGINHDEAGLRAELPAIKALAEQVKRLYDTMDTAFNFYTSDKKKESSQEIKKDFRGVTCPMNFVKTKIELAKLQPKDRLEILLDDGEPIENVPGSVRGEGHIILKQEKVGDHWSVLIEKAS